METLTIIILAIIVVAIYLMWRNDKVFDFQREISHKCHDVLRNFLYSLKDDEELNERYEEFVEYLKAEIDKTPIGRKNTLRGVPNYSSYEEFISGGERA